MHHKEIRILSIIFAALVLLFAFSFLPFFGSAKTKVGVKTVESALLNTKYNDKIARIVIVPPKTADGAADTLILERKLDAASERRWYIVLGDVKLPAIQNTVQNFISLSEQVRTMEELSRNKNNFADFGLSDEQAVNIRFESERTADVAESNTIFSSVFFGSHDITGNYINVRAENTVYRIRNDFSPYLPQSLKNYTVFADLSLIIASGKKIKRAVLTDFITGKSAVLENAQHETLVSLHGIGVLDETQTQEKTNSENKSILRIEFDDAQIHIYTVYPEAFVTDSGYALEISAWTYKTLTAIFFDTAPS